MLPFLLGVVSTFALAIFKPEWFMAVKEKGVGVLKSLGLKSE